MNFVKHATMPRQQSMTLYDIIKERRTEPQQLFESNESNSGRSLRCCSHCHHGERVTRHPASASLPFCFWNMAAIDFLIMGCRQKCSHADQFLLVIERDRFECVAAIHSPCVHPSQIFAAEMKVFTPRILRIPKAPTRRSDTSGTYANG